MPNSEQCPMCKSTDRNMTPEGWTCVSKWHYDPQPPVPEVESGDGLPPLELTKEDKAAAWKDASPEAQRYISPGELRASLKARERQLRSALEREERLKGLLQMCSNHIGSRAGEGAIEVMREIKAAVTGDSEGKEDHGTNHKGDAVWPYSGQR